MRRHRLQIAIASALGAAVAWHAAPPAAAASGFWPGGASNAVSAPGSVDRYTALSPARLEDHEVTVVVQTERGSGRVTRWWRLKGPYQLPPLSSGGAGGISADGGTLVLSRRAWIFPPRSAGLAILDTERRTPGGDGSPRPHAQATVTRVRLPDSYTFNAISPDGSRIYLTHHLSPIVGGPFEIRALSREGDLLPRSAVRPAGPERPMAGFPIPLARGDADGRRAYDAAANGRWTYAVYIAYRRQAKPPGVVRDAFALALDTITGRTERLELPQLEDRDAFALFGRESDRGLRLSVFEASPGEERPPLATIRMRPLRVVAPAAGIGADREDALPWVAVGALALVLGVGFAMLPRDRRGGDANGQRERG